MCNKSRVKESLVYLGKKYGITQKALSEALGLTYQAFNMKVNGHSDFTRIEIMSIMNLFGLSPRQLVYVFFELESEGSTFDVSVFE